MSFDKTFQYTKPKIEQLIISVDDYTQNLGIMIDHVNALMGSDDPHNPENITFKSVLAIARGGLIPAQDIAYRCGIRQVYSFGAQSYEGEESNTLVVYQNIPDDIKGPLLVVDDIADSGRTLDYVKNILRNKGVWYYTMSMYEKPRSIFKPDFSVKTISDDTWVVFPYDVTKLQQTV